jgi:hypothetical protein
MTAKLITRSEMQTRINFLREELENRHKYGTVKIANSDGTPVSTLELQNELYSLIYKLSKRET